VHGVIKSTNATAILAPIIIYLCVIYNAVRVVALHGASIGSARVVMRNETFGIHVTVISIHDASIFLFFLIYLNIYERSDMKREQIVK
jgi:hypothetical protein